MQVPSVRRMATVAGMATVLTVFFFVTTKSGIHESQARSAAHRIECARNLKTLGGLLMERATSRQVTRERGPAFLLQLSRSGMIRAADVRIFVCPVDPKRARVEDPEFSAKFRNFDLKSPDPTLTSYAVRDFERFPIAPHGTGREPWALCPWHQGGVPVLYDDGSVVFHEREALGLQPGDPIVLGPDAKNETLRMFLPLAR